MSDVELQVIEESKRFRAALPQLLGWYRNRWVVFKDGQVRNAHEEHDAAYAAAVKEYGVRGGFVVARVEEDTGPVPVTAGLYFGLSST